jgi:hypothetical protein
MKFLAPLEYKQYNFGHKRSCVVKDSMVVVRVIWQIVISLPFLRRNEQMKNPLAHPTDIRIAAVSAGARCSSECKSVLHHTSGDRAHNFLVHFTQLSSLLTANKPSNRSPSSNPIPCTSYLVPRRRRHRRQLVHSRARAHPGVDCRAPSGPIRTRSVGDRQFQYDATQ